MSAPAPTAARAGLLPCHACNLLVRRPAGRGLHLHCPRCDAPLHARKPDSLARTAALLFAAAILYVPANVFPITTIVSFGRAQSDTILSGVEYLLHEGMWELAALIFFASIMVPMLKLVGLLFLVWSVHRKWTWRPRDRTRLYLWIETIGRWSMIDIFVISLLVALVQLGNIATIETGVAATCFAAVVVITMVASMSFDPRLIWDAAEEGEAEAEARPLPARDEAPSVT